MDRYIVSVWGKRLFVTVLFFAALMFGIRQLSLTIKDWMPQKQVAPVVKVVPPVPDEPKTIGKNFLLNWFFTGDKESADQKEKRLADLISPKVNDELGNNPELIIQSPAIKPNSVDWLNSKWIELEKKAFIQYQVQLADGREMRLQLPLVKGGDTWMVDGLPTLLPQPVKGNPKYPDAPTLNPQEQKDIQQVVDGFFDSWLRGREDQNTKGLNIPPTDVLDELQGTYEGVTIQPIQEDPFTISAIVFINSNGQRIPFEYQLVLNKEGSEYTVTKILGGK